EYLDAIEHIPNGATLLIHNVSWDDYERLLENGRHLRITFDAGELEIMSPLAEHEEYGRFIDRLVHMLCEELDLKLQSYGSATWKRRGLMKGVEADACYYIVHANQVI